MNQTFNKRPYNPMSFDLFLNSGKESRQKKANNAYNNSKATYKQAIISGANYPRQSQTIFNNYSHLSSLTKCNSTTKLTKTHSNCNMSASSKSFISYVSPDIQQQHHHHQHQQHMNGSPSPSPHQINLSKNHNEKSVSTTQSTDERKELNKLRIELKEKNDIIKALNRTIENYKYEKKNSSKDLMRTKMQLAELKLENTRIKQDNKTLQLELDKVKNENNKLQSKEFKLSEIMNILTKEEMSMYKAEDTTTIKGDEPSLIGICFTDKIKMDNKIDSNDNKLPALDFGRIRDELQSSDNILKKNKSMCNNEIEQDEDDGLEMEMEMELEEQEEQKKKENHHYHHHHHQQKHMVKNNSYVAIRHSNSSLLNNNNSSNNKSSNAQCSSYHQSSSQHNNTNSLIPMSLHHGHSHHNINNTGTKSKIIFGRKSSANANKTEGVGLYMNNSLGNIRK